MIYSEKAFNESLPAQYDGLFDWDWMANCFGESKIMPMDIDGVVERKGNFLKFESKEVGKAIPMGQLFTLQAYHRLECFTVLFVYGKKTPEMLASWDAPDFRSGVVMDETKPVKVTVLQAQNYVAAWYRYADSNPKYPKGRWLGKIPDCAENDPIPF